MRYKKGRLLKHFMERTGRVPQRAYVIHSNDVDRFDEELRRSSHDRAAVEAFEHVVVEVVHDDVAYFENVMGSAFSIDVGRREMHQLLWERTPTMTHMPEVRIDMQRVPFAPPMLTLTAPPNDPIGQRGAKFATIVLLMVAKLEAGLPGVGREARELRALRERAERWEPSGDAMRIVRSGWPKPARRAAPVDSGLTRDELIRRRRHAVRGHWRTYPSGARVWVDAHERGDADLGRSSRVVELVPRQEQTP